MKKLMIVSIALILSACATHTPAKMPKGKPFPINTNQQTLEHLQQTDLPEVDIYKGGQ